MSIVKIANEGAKRLVKDMPAPKPVYRIVWASKWWHIALETSIKEWKLIYENNSLVACCYRVK